MINFQLKGPHIALCDLLKVEGIAESGGQAKAMVAEGMVKVDDKIERRKTAKMSAGQIIECKGRRIRIVAEKSI